MKRTLAFVLMLAIAGCGSKGPTGGDGTDGGGGGGNWLAGNRGALLSSKDGFNYVMHAARSGDDLLSIFCVQRIYGWAVGAGGFLMTTRDGGATWTTQQTGTVQTLRAVAFADVDHGLTVGDAGTILRSTDGGLHWTQSATPTNRTLRAVAMGHDGKTAWVAGDGGFILRSSDGGVSWAQYASYDAPNQIDWRAIKFAHDDLNGYLVGVAGHVMVTRDGGHGWSAGPKAAHTLRGLAVSHPGDLVVAVGEAGTIWRSSDSGKTFADATSGTLRSLAAVGLEHDRDRLWVVGEAGTILRSDDKAAGFTSIPSPTQLDLNSLEDF